MIFALGVLVIPKQILFGQNSEMSCCVSSSEKTDDCCGKSKGHEMPSDKSKGDNHCDDDCNACRTCHTFVVFYPTVPEKVSYTLNKIQVTKENFNYVIPEFSDIYSKIWQPPKIG